MKSLQTPALATSLVYIVLLKDGYGYGYDLSKRTGCTSGTLAHCFEILRGAGIVNATKSNRRTIYRVTSEGRRALGASLEKALHNDVFADRPEFHLDMLELRKCVDKMAFEAQYGN